MLPWKFAMSKLPLNSIRPFLERNKVIFETVAALLVSIMAILVSYGQLRIAKIQTDLQLQQTRISKQAVLPHFVISAKQLKGATNSQTFDEDEITVENQGSVISNFYCSGIVLLDVELMNWNSPTEKSLITFYLNGYYLGNAYSPQGQGILITIKGYKNNQIYVDLERAFSKLAQSQNEFGNTTLRRFLYITYTDQLGYNHGEYYYVPLIYGASRINEEEGKAIFSGYRNSFGTKQFVEFDKLTAENLHKLVAGK